MQKLITQSKYDFLGDFVCESERVYKYLSVEVFTNLFGQKATDLWAVKITPFFDKIWHGRITEQ